MNNERIQVSYIEADKKISSTGISGATIILTPNDTGNYFDQPRLVFTDAGILKSTGPQASLEYRAITLGVNVRDDSNGADLRKIYSGQNAPIVTLTAGPAVYSQRDGVTILNNKSATSNNQYDYILFIDTNTGSSTYGGVKIGGLTSSNIVKNSTNPIAPGFLLDVSGNIRANNIIYNTGNQNISGVKTFATGIIAPNLVYNTGDQTISGIKAFSDYIQLTNQNDGIRFNNNGSIYSTSVVGNESGITLTTFQQPTDIVRRNNFVGGNSDEVISILNANTSNIFGQSINGVSDQIVIYNTGLIFGVPSSKGPYLRLGDNNIISEKSASKLGIGTLFPSEKVHISGGNLKVEGDAIANNLVYNTGNQTISGTKNFQNTIQFSGQDILVAPADYIYITGNQTSIINGTKYLADTTSASFGFNLPASPTTGDYLEFLDPFYTWSGNNFILSGNGNNIESDAVFTGDIEGASIRTIYVGKTYGWRVKYNI